MSIVFLVTPVMLLPTPVDLSRVVLQPAVIPQLHEGLLFSNSTQLEELVTFRPAYTLSIAIVPTWTGFEFTRRDLFVPVQRDSGPKSKKPSMRTFVNALARLCRLCFGTLSQKEYIHNLEIEQRIFFEQPLHQEFLQTTESDKGRTNSSIDERNQKLIWFVCLCFLRRQCGRLQSTYSAGYRK